MLAQAPLMILLLCQDSNARTGSSKYKANFYLATIMSFEHDCECFEYDYLVVEAGALGLAFVDALIFNPLPMEQTGSKFLNQAELVVFCSP